MYELEMQKKHPKRNARAFNERTPGKAYMSSRFLAQRLIGRLSVIGLKPGTLILMLPNPHALSFGYIHSVARLDIVCFIKQIEILQHQIRA